ncbi:MAG: ZIP family metal transporter [Candidatus Ranarchaeia archaeon]
MSEVWFFSILSVIIVSLVSLIGIFGLLLNEEKLKKSLLFLVGISTGGLFGGAFIHLLPEIVTDYGFTLEISLSLLSGILVFFTIEKFISWRHCHIPISDDHPHPFAFMNLFGDALHNLIDGLIIGASYLVSIPIGIATTLAVVLHEIPQEIGDFGVLIHGGFSKKRALLVNFLTALIAIAGVVISLVLFGFIGNISYYLIPFAAGNFIYIAGSDLIPELKKDTTSKSAIVQLTGIILGIAAMLLIIFI